MGSITDKYDIVKFGGVEVETESCNSICRETIEKILQKFPVKYYIVNETVDPRESFAKDEKGIMEVFYHGARVIEIYPPKGKRQIKN